MSEPDPKPRPPEKPLSGDCCESGCESCVFTVYAEQLEEYAWRLADWRQRHPDEPTIGDCDRIAWGSSSRAATYPAFRANAKWWIARITCNADGGTYPDKVRVASARQRRETAGQAALLPSCNDAK